MAVTSGARNDVERRGSLVIRAQWSNQLEFLLSCLSMSVGLGNVWRFPFTAYENGGGAFLVPYIIILLLLGKPLYYLELVVGQFSSFGCVGIWNSVPAFKGVGYGQTFSVSCIISYYAALMAITLHYMFSSMRQQLPWARCHHEWVHCVHAVLHNHSEQVEPIYEDTLSSAEYYFKNITGQIIAIDDGIGSPRLSLSLFLLAVWIITFACIVKGVKTSGKAAYFTAIFPYTVLVVLFIRGVTLPGAVDGIIYYLNPQWHKLLEAKVWFAAVTQCFFSLGIGFGVIPMLASYNPFSHSITRDATIVSLADMATSFLSGFTIFSVLGNLAHEKGVEITQVIQTGGPSLAFISYPQALANFPAVPQLFSVMFFLMLFTLGLGTLTALTSGVITVICDAAPRLSRRLTTIVVCIMFFLAGIVYITPGGLLILDLVDYFGGSLLIFGLVVLEVIGLVWIYGVAQLCICVKAMLGHRPNLYWRSSWMIVSPLILISIFCYSMYKPKLPKQGDNSSFPTYILGLCWGAVTTMLLFVITYFVAAVCSQSEQLSLFQKVRSACQPSVQWKPRSVIDCNKWTSVLNDECVKIEQ